MSTAHEIWNMVVDRLSQKLTATSISAWFADCEPLDIDARRLILRTDNELKKDVLSAHFSQQIKDALCELFSTEDYELLVLSKDERFDAPDGNTDGTLPKKPGFTFSDFVVGDSNRLAYKAACAVAEDPGKSYNPLFIYGNSGLGKTHLLLAIGHAIREAHPEMSVAFVRGEGFTVEMVKAIREGASERFHEKYRKVDLLLMDDVQFIAGKEATQEEFFNTFNELYEADKQIVICSDRPPVEMPLLGDRLRTRFEGGLMADIIPPGPETRAAILRAKASKAELSLSEDSVSYIASKVTANVRQLEGVIQKINAYYQLIGTNLSREQIDRIIEDVSRDANTMPSCERIIREAARYYSLTPEDLKRNDQTKRVALARQISMYLMRKLRSMTFTDIGAIFKRDHSTVVSSVRKIEGLTKNDPDMPNILRDIESNITNSGA